MKRVAGAVLLAALSGCGSPQRLPVQVFRCDAVQTRGGFDIHADVKNLGHTPIANLEISTEFYHDFRYTKYMADTRLRRELDPGDHRTIDFRVDTGKAAAGEAMRCIVTHIGYLDGTSADIPPGQ